MNTLASTFQCLNDLSAGSVIREYAVAGATAAMFYMEAVRTYNLDVFVMLPPQTGSILSMEPLYSELKRSGYSFDAEHVIINGVPVQFIPSYCTLSDEAMKHTMLLDYDGVSVPVLKPEYLVALWIDAGGAKRIQRARDLASSESVHGVMLDEILDRFGLEIR